LSIQRIAKSFALADSQVQDVVHNLYLAGFISREFGVCRKGEDAVLRDILDCLYQREIQEKPAHELERDILESMVARRGQAVRFDLVLPMAKEAELVAAQSLEQMAKNMNISQEAVAQMQIAVIEACINALEHSRGMGNQVYVSIAVDGDQLQVSVESAGREFIVQETGEPFRDQEAVKASGRGWGVKLIRRFVDQVRFEKTARGTRIVLIKKIERSAGIQKEDIVNRE
jgi:serine/threonine-protein kinase RsbW